MCVYMCKCVCADVSVCYGFAGTVYSSPPTPHRGSRGPARRLCARDGAGQGSMCSLCGLLFLTVTRPGIFQLRGTQARSRASRDRGWAWGMGLLGPWGSLGVGAGKPVVSGAGALTLIQRGTAPHLSLCPGLCASVSLVARKGLCSQPPTPQGTNLASQVTHCAV